MDSEGLGISIPYWTLVSLSFPYKNNNNNNNKECKI